MIIYIASSISTKPNLPRCIAGVCESQVSGAQLVEHSQDTQTGADGMSALHANETGDLASPVRLLDSRSSRDQRHVMRIELNKSTNQVDLLQRQLHCIQMLGWAGGIGGPELGGDHALLQAAQVCVTPGTRRPGSQFPQIAAKVEVLQLVLQKLANIPRQIVVSVDEGHFLQDIPHALHPEVEVVGGLWATAAGRRRRSGRASQD